MGTPGRLDPGNDIAVQLAADPAGLTRGPVRQLLGQPFPSHGLEVVSSPLPFRLFLGLAVGARIDISGQKLTGSVAPLAGQLQRPFGIDAERVPFLLVGEAVLEAPGLGAVRGGLAI